MSTKIYTATAPIGTNPNLAHEEIEVRPAFQGAKPFIDNNKMAILSFIELYMSEISVARTMSDVRKYYENLVYYRILLHYYEHKTSLEDFRRKTVRINNARRFSLDFSVSDSEISDNARLKAKLEKMIVDFDAYFEQYYQYCIPKNNKAQKRFDKLFVQTPHTPKIYTKEIAGKVNIATEIKKSALYYTYTFLSVTDVKQNYANLGSSRDYQIKVRNYVGDKIKSRPANKNYIRAGIIEQTGMSPENFINFCKTHKVSQVGAILTTIISILSIVALLIDLFGKIFGKGDNDVPTKAELEKTASDTGDLFLDKEKSSSKGFTNPKRSSSNFSNLALLGAGLFLITKTK